MLLGYHSLPDPLMQYTQEQHSIAGRLQQLGYESLHSSCFLYYTVFLGLTLLKKIDVLFFLYKGDNDVV